MIHWNFDPILLTVGPLTIRWYGVLFVGAFLAGQWMLARMFERERVPGRSAERLMLYALIGTVLGARLVHVLFYDQLYEAGGYLATFFVLRRVYTSTRERTPAGRLFGWFLLLVFLVRMAAEFFKTPQAAYEDGQLFTVGQYLSLPFVMFGVGLLVWSRRKA